MTALFSQMHRQSSTLLLTLKLSFWNLASEMTTSASAGKCNGKRINLCLRKQTRAELESSEDIPMGFRKQCDEERGDRGMRSGFNCLESAWSLWMMRYVSGIVVLGHA